MGFRRVIELAEARQLLARALETQGRDFVYNPGGKEASCFNVPSPEDHLGNKLPEDAPQRKTGCLVGTALSLAGIPELSKELEASPKSGIWTFSSWLGKGVFTYFRKAQISQDSGLSWGEAYDRAEAAVRELERVGEAA